MRVWTWADVLVNRFSCVNVLKSDYMEVACVTIQKKNDFNDILDGLKFFLI